MTEEINIEGIDKAALLAALYNNAQPVGFGMLHFEGEPMTHKEAADLLKEFTYFDYVKGRPLKIDLSKDTLRVGLYDRDQGEGQGRAIIDSLRKGKR